MSNEQIRNSINLCKGQPISKILQLFSAFGWRRAQMEAMAEYFHCPKTNEDVAMHLHMGF